ncbi:LysR family transcriptional regulator [Amnibacterium flavum]|uniref:LysR family transcriptional regulator n=1 Tax=Amnibacterium flavum TaxID=2173173 RepID=A0A2V1HTZ5_9MICO|nr:LysR family transcriptional regulator [Amnibacterium flavum]PVZ93777.1 LysR family transcriptional regulator [Amnibacterium flavum]
MDVRRLELLRELAERGSVSAVAQATHRTPSAVSQQLKVLEREIGTALTERHGRGVILTDAGKALARTATDIAVAMERAEALWTEYLGTPSGEVTLATFPTAGQMFLPGLLTRLEEHPGIRLIATDHDPSLDGFAELAHDHDIVLAHSPDGPRAWRTSELHIVDLMTEPLDVALPPDHRLASKTVLRPSDLAGEPWIGVPLDFPFQQVLLEIEKVTGEAPNVRQRFSDTRIVESLVQTGHGVAILPRFTAGSTASEITLRPLEGVSAERHISALSRPDRAERPSVRLILDALRAEAEAIMGANTA